MKFFDDKEEVIDIQLTQFGKHLLSMGKWKPTYYAFFDDNIIYDSSFAGITEPQNSTEPRIQENTPQMHTQHVFSGRETDFLKIVGSKDDPFEREEDKINVQSTPERDYSLVSPLGSSEYGSQAAPRWSVKVLQGKITNTEGFLTGSYRTLKIPQLEMALTYTIHPQDILDYPGRESFGQIDAEDLALGVFPDGSFFEVQEETILLDLDELNVPFDVENFDIEVFEMEEATLPGTSNPTIQNLNQLYFEHKKPQIVNNILVADTPDKSLIQKDSNYVGYYFDVFVDDEIDPSVMATSVDILRSKGLYVDSAYHRPIIPLVATAAELYRDTTSTTLVVCADDNAQKAPKASIVAKSGPFIATKKPFDSGDENS